MDCVEEFEGRIVEINDDEFTAILIGTDGYELIADFKVADLPVGDGEPLQVGDLFWAPAMKLIHPEPITEQQVAAIYAKAEAQFKRLEELMD